MLKFLFKQTVKSVVNAGANVVAEVNEEVKKLNDSGTKQGNKLSKEVLTDKHVKMCLNELRYGLEAPHLNVQAKYDNVKGIVTSWDITAKNTTIKSFTYKNELEKYIKELVIGDDNDKKKLDLLTKYITAIEGDLEPEIMDSLLAARLNICKIRSEAE